MFREKLRTTSKVVTGWLKRRQFDEDRMSPTRGSIGVQGNDTSSKSVKNERMRTRGRPEKDDRRHDDISSQFQNSVCIKIESSNAHVSSFSVPVSLVLKRELEMQAAARNNKIGKERWTSSRVFRMWKSQSARQQRIHQTQTLKHGSCQREVKNLDNSSEIVLRMTPEISLKNSNSSCRLYRWKPWLTTCISSYYNTGKLRIPNECTGDDILLTLEYFGILTASPDIFLFETSSAYVRTQAWSRYFTHRAALGESLLEAYDDEETREQRDQKEREINRTKTLTWVLLKDDEYEEKDQFHVVGEVSSSPDTMPEESVCHTKEETMTLKVNRTGGLYELFLGEKKSTLLIDREYTAFDEGDGETNTSILLKELSSRMRRDFCQHLFQSLPPWISVQFDIEQVEVIPTYTTAERHSGPTSQCRPVIRLSHNQRHGSTSISNKERGSSFTSHLTPVQEYKDSGLARSDDPLGPLDISSYRPIEEAPSLLIADKADTYFNGSERNESKEMVSHCDNDDIGSKATFISADTISELKLEGKRRSKKAQQFHEQISYINMDLGDLRSVTSVLSVPIANEMYGQRGSVRRTNDEGQFQEESTVLAKAKSIVRERSERKSQKHHTTEKEKSESCPSLVGNSEMIKTPPRTTRTPWDLGQTPTVLENEVGFRAFKTNNGSAASCNEESILQVLNETKPALHSDTSEWEDDNSDPNSKIELADSHDSWGHLIASMCEAMIPVPSSNTLSSSPTRKFDLSSKMGSISCDLLTADEQKTSRKDRQISGVEPRTIGLVDQAKRMGNDLSNQLDELMRKAYQEEVPTMLAINTDEDLTLASCLTSSVIGHQCTNQTREKLGKVRGMKSRSRSKKMSKSIPYDIPKSRNFESDGFRVKSDVLPNRTNELRISKPSRGKQEVLTKGGKDSNFATTKGIPKVVKSSNSTKERSRISSMSNSTSGYLSNDYSKENRYSRHENRFYS